MRLCILANPDRSMSSSVDAAMIDGAALADALRRSGHDVELMMLPNQDATWLQRGVAALEPPAACSPQDRRAFRIALKSGCKYAAVSDCLERRYGDF